MRARSVPTLLLLATACCDATHEPSATDQERLEELEERLQAGAAAVQEVLLDPAYHDGLRDREAFREALHAAAVRHAVSGLDLCARDEPGEWIEIHGRLVDETGGPVAGGIVRVFSTDAEGRYHPEIEGESVPRIFGTLVSDADGRFRVGLVRPGPYPGTRNARHIHISARAGSLRLAAPYYAVFDDDPLLMEPQNAEPRGEALRIAMSAAGGVQRGTLELPMR